jgi:hypothetical protein
MVTGRRSFQGHWDRLRFRDYLVTHPTSARAYARLKEHLASIYPNDRVAYTKAKTKFIRRVMARAAKSPNQRLERTRARSLNGGERRPLNRRT